MKQLKSALLVEFKRMRLLLFSVNNGKAVYVNEARVEYGGFSPEGFLNPDDVFSKIKELFSMTERYGALAKNCLVVLPGVFFTYDVDERKIPIPTGKVLERDVEALVSSCGKKLAGFEAVRRYPIFYKTAYNPVVDNPIGEKTDALWGTASIEYLSLTIKELFDNSAKRLNKKFSYMSFGAVSASSAEKEKHSSERIVINFMDGFIEVALSSGSSPLQSETFMYGSLNLSYGLADSLGVSDDLAAEIAVGANLNIAYSDTDEYIIGQNIFAVSQVNTLLVDYLEFYAENIVNLILSLTNNSAVEICLCGSKICSVRGVREIFEVKIGNDITVLFGNMLNLSGSENYIASGAGELLCREEAGFLKDLFSRIKSLIYRT